MKSWTCTLARLLPGRSAPGFRPSRLLLPDGTRGEFNLGLLTIAHDYDARLAWRFDTLPGNGGETIVVTTMVQLAL